jgi:nucleoside-diphosphate-sugar epimerase
MTNLSAKSRKNILAAGGTREPRDATRADVVEGLLVSRAREGLGWVPRRSLSACVESAGAWQRDRS